MTQGGKLPVCNVWPVTLILDIGWVMDSYVILVFLWHFCTQFHSLLSTNYLHGVLRLRCRNKGFKYMIHPVTEVKGARLGGDQGQVYMVLKLSWARQAKMGKNLDHSAWESSLLGCTRSEKVDLALPMPVLWTVTSRPAPLPPPFQNLVPCPGGNMGWSLHRPVLWASRQMSR